MQKNQSMDNIALLKNVQAKDASRIALQQETFWSDLGIGVTIGASIGVVAVFALSKCSNLKSFNTHSLAWSDDSINISTMAISKLGSLPVFSILRYDGGDFDQSKSRSLLYSKIRRQFWENKWREEKKPVNVVHAFYVFCYILS